MTVRVESANLCVYPDEMAVCGARQSLDDRRDVVTNPPCIVEVLSDSTDADGRGEKFAYYRSIPGLRAYQLLSQQRASAELVLRQPSGDRLLCVYTDPSESIPLTVLDTELSLAEVYDKVEFNADNERRLRSADTSAAAASAQ